MWKQVPMHKYFKINYVYGFVPFLNIYHFLITTIDIFRDFDKFYYVLKIIK